MPCKSDGEKSRLNVIRLFSFDTLLYHMRRFFQLIDSL